MNAGRHIRYHILCKRTVSLPSVSPSLRLLTVDEKSLPALVTVSASLDMVYNYPVAFLKIQNAFSNLYYLAAGLVSCNHIVISCSPGLIRMFMINKFKVTSAQACCLHFQKHLSVSRLRHILFHLLYPVASRQFHTDHFFWHFITHIRSPP